MSYFFQFVLASDLKLEDLICIFLIFNLLGHLLSFIVHSILIKCLGMIELVRIYFRIELSELVIHVSCICIILDIEVAVP